jgi:hypothetical protein
MSENKISVREYLDNKELLEINYTPHDIKNNIVDVMLSQVVVRDGLQKINSVLLNRISTQIFIESITNIDMSVKSDKNLDGYDELCFNNELEELLEIISNEYSRFEYILKLKIDDLNRYNNSTSATILSLKKSVVDFVKKKSDEINQFINNIDTQTISNNLKVLINDNLKKYKGE